MIGWRPVGVGLAACVAFTAVTAAMFGVGMADTGTASAPKPATIGAGHHLFQQSCSSCHGDRAQGVRGVAPALVGVGAQAADFELTTGRMPLATANAEPVRSHPELSTRQIRSLVAYIGSLGGPAVPVVNPARGSIVTGRALFASNCASCHQITGSGGVVPGASVPALQSATPAQIGEAIRMGPYLMPRFSASELSPRDVDAISRYVISTRHPNDPGGWSIGHLGPVPEGLVAWGVGILALLVVARLIGERSPT